MHTRTHTQHILFALFLSHVPLVPFFQRLTWISAWRASVLKRKQNKRVFLKRQRSKNEKALAVSPVQSVVHRCSISGHTLNITSSVISTAEVLCTADHLDTAYLRVRTYVSLYVCSCTSPLAVNVLTYHPPLCPTPQLCLVVCGSVVRM